MTLTETRDLLKFLLGGFPTQRQWLSKSDVTAMLGFYAAGLEDVDYEDARRAAVRLCRTAEKIPSVAAIRAAIGVIEHGHQRTGVEAWEEVHKAIRRYGWNRTPGVDFHFADPITDRVVCALSWHDICHEDNTSHVRARFIDAYNTIGKQERQNAQALPGAKNPAQLGIAIRAALPAGERLALTAGRDRDGARTMAELVADLGGRDDEA